MLFAEDLGFLLLFGFLLFGGRFLVWFFTFKCFASQINGVDMWSWFIGIGGGRKYDGGRGD